MINSPQIRSLAQYINSRSSKFFLAFFLCFFLQHSLFSQVRAVIKDDPYLVLNTAATTGEVYVVLDNGNTNALATSGTGGNIITKKEKTQVKWNVGTNTGTYTIPFTTATTATNASESKIPASVNITGAGTGSGNLKLSSYTDNDATNNQLNSEYAPSDVTTFLDADGADNSLNVVNRFWIVDANGFTTKPTTTLSFTWDDEEVTGGGNTVSEADLFPQRFNSVESTWIDVTLSGTLNTTANTLSGVNVSSGDFFKSWALVSSVTPLPVELTKFDSKCEENTISVNWTTASEINNDYFVIQQSSDGENWVVIDSVNGAGNSLTERNYTYQIKHNKSELTYLQLKQVDYDGTASLSDIKSCKCSGGLEITDVFPNPSDGEINYTIQATQAGVMSMKIHDATGRVIKSETHPIQKGNNVLTSFVQAEMGKYFITVEMDNGKFYDYDVIMIK